MKKKDYKITNVKLSDKKSLELFRKFYNEIFLAEFLDPKICENIDHYIEVLENNIIDDPEDNELFITLFHNDTNILGGIIYVYLSAVNSGVVEYAVINKEYRGNGLGYSLYKYAKEKLNNFSIDNAGKPLDFIFGEVSKPEILEQFNVYKAFWNKIGFRRLMFEYIQPPLDEEKLEDREHMLMVDSLKGSKSISVEVLKKVLFEFFKFSFLIDRPKMNKQYKEMFNNVRFKQIIIKE